MSYSLSTQQDDMKVFTTNWWAMDVFSQVAVAVAGCYDDDDDDDKD